MSFRKWNVVVVALSLIATSIFSLGAQAAPEPKSVYIVKFLDNVSLGNEISSVKKNGVTVNEVLEFAFKGFIGEMTSAQALALSKNPRVDFVEADAEVQAYADPAFYRSTLNSDLANRLWGLDRVDQKGVVTMQYSAAPSVGLDGYYAYTSTGKAVPVYVVDTGILASHSEFANQVNNTFRVVPGFSAFKDKTGTSDCNGHGTHVAGTIGGQTVGIAPEAKLIAVRVLNCQGSGTTSGVTSGLNWIADSTKNKNGIGVVNMSLGGGGSSSIDSAVQSLINKNQTVVVAAGNENLNPCSSVSPARVRDAITVGATSSDDTRASFSNFGTCLDIFAPGVNIFSVSIKSSTSYTTMSGTSMATPHVVGAVARYLEFNQGITPAAVASALIANATTVNKDLGVGSPKILLYSDPLK